MGFLINWDTTAVLNDIEVDLSRWKCLFESVSGRFEPTTPALQWKSWMVPLGEPFKVKKKERDKERDNATRPWFASVIVAYIIILARP